MEIEIYDINGELLEKKLISSETVSQGKSISYQGKFYRLEDDAYHEIDWQPAIYATVF